MKVRELIAELECYPEDAEVHMAYGAGDYWRTTLAPKVGHSFWGFVEKSEYHQTFKLVDEPEPEEIDPDYPVIKVVVIE